MTNGEKYAGSTHNHYVFERMCPRCNCFVCGREPSDLRECLIKDVRDYQKWLQFECVSGADFALERLEEAEKPYAWLKLGVSYFIPVPAVSDLYKVVTYTADDWDKRVMKRGIAFQTKEEAIECAKKMLAAVKQEG